MFKISGLQKKKKGPVHHLLFRTFLWNEMNRSEKRFRCMYVCSHVEGCFIVCRSSTNLYIEIKNVRNCEIDICN